MGQSLSRRTPPTYGPGRNYKLLPALATNMSLTYLLTRRAIYTRGPVINLTFHLKTVIFLDIHTGYLVEIEDFNKAPLCKGSWIAVGKTEGLSFK